MVSFMFLNFSALSGATGVRVFPLVHKCKSVGLSSGGVAPWWAPPPRSAPAVGSGRFLPLSPLGRPLSPPGIPRRSALGRHRPRFPRPPPPSASLPEFLIASPSLVRYSPFVGLSAAVALGSSLCGACCRSGSPVGRNSSSALRVALVASLIFAIGSRLALGLSLCVARGRSGSRKRGTPPACLASLLSPRCVLRWRFASAGSRARRFRVATSPS